MGTGAFGRHHVRILSSLNGSRLIGIYDAAPGVGREVAAEHQTRAFGSLAELASECDAAVLAVPTIAHLEVGRALLEKGLHLLIEKPIAASLSEADELVELAADRVLAVGHVEFYNPAVQALLGLAQVPGFVEVQRRAAFSPRSLDVDVVLDLMIHDLQILHALDASGVREIRATGIPVLSGRTDIANVRIAFASGMVANLTASRVSAQRDRKLRAFFQNEYYSLDYERQEIKGYRRTDRDGQLHIESADLAITKGEPLRLELEAFTARCRGEAGPLADGRQGRRALETALEINHAIGR